MRSHTWIPVALVAIGLTPTAALAQATQPQGERANQREVSLDGVPAPVRETIEKQADGGRVLEVSRSNDNGKKYYTAWIQKGEDKFGSVMDESGKVVRYERPDQQNKAQATEHPRKKSEKGTGGGPTSSKHDKKHHDEGQPKDSASGDSPNRSSGSSSGGEKSGSEKSGSEKSGSEKSGGEKSGSEKSGGEKKDTTSD